MKVTAKILALDADGTIFHDAFAGGMDEAHTPIPLIPKHDVIARVKQRIAEGWDVILWTCRTDALLDQAVAFCKEHDIRLTAVNAPHPQVLAMCEYLGISVGPKLFAHEYWDDKAVTLSMICGTVE